MRKGDIIQCRASNGAGTGALYIVTSSLKFGGLCQQIECGIPTTTRKRFATKHMVRLAVLCVHCNRATIRLLTQPLPPSIIRYDYDKWKKTLSKIEGLIKTKQEFVLRMVAPKCDPIYIKVDNAVRSVTGLGTDNKKFHVQLNNVRIC